MEYNIVNCEKDDEKYICDRLVEYNLGQVPKTQAPEFVFIDKKIVDKDNKIMAGCIAKMYCCRIAQRIIVDIFEKGFKKSLK